MKHFKEFMNEFYHFWLKKQPTIKSFKSEMEKDVEAHIFLQQKLSNLGYSVLIFNKNRLPASIFSISNHKSFIHIWLFQIGTRRIGSYNSDDVKKRDIENLKKLTLLLKNHFYRSELTKQFHKKPLLITSCDTTIDLYQDKLGIGWLDTRRLLTKGLDGEALNRAIDKYRNLEYEKLLHKNVFSQKLFDKLDKENPKWVFTNYDQYKATKGRQ